MYWLIRIQIEKHGQKGKKKHRQILSGDVPSPINTPKGCNFAGRCPVACDKCRESKPQLREIRPGHFCACHLVEPEI